MSKPEVTSITVTAFDAWGAARAKPFIQGMLNRLGFGAVRYGRTHEDDVRDADPKDMIATAIRRARIGLETGQRELYIDAANFLVLAWHHSPEAPSLDGDSPGMVYGGIVSKARGRWAADNDKPDNAPPVVPVSPSTWANIARANRTELRERHYTGGPASYDVV